MEAGAGACGHTSGDNNRRRNPVRETAGLRAGSRSGSSCVPATNLQKRRVSPKGAGDSSGTLRSCSEDNIHLSKCWRGRSSSSVDWPVQSSSPASRRRTKPGFHRVSSRLPSGGAGNGSGEQSHRTKATIFPTIPRTLGDPTSGICFTARTVRAYPPSESMESSCPPGPTAGLPRTAA